MGRGILAAVVLLAIGASQTHRAAAPRAAKQPERVDERVPVVAATTPSRAPAVAVHDASLDELYDFGFVTDEEAHVAQADRGLPRVDGTAPFAGAFVVEVVHAMRISELNVLFKDGSGRWTLWLPPGQYHMRARGRGGAVTPSVTVDVAGATVVTLR